MQSLLIWLICITAISFAVMAVVRTCLKNESKELSKELEHISPYKDKSNYEQAKERLSALNDSIFIDIPTDLNNEFRGKIISTTQEIDFTNHYKSYFQEAHSLAMKLKAFHIAPSEAISKLIRDFGDINGLVKQHNETVINHILDTHKDF